MNNIAALILGLLALALAIAQAVELGVTFEVTADAKAQGRQLKSIYFVWFPGLIALALGIALVALFIAR